MHESLVVKLRPGGHATDEHDRRYLVAHELFRDVPCTVLERFLKTVSVVDYPKGGVIVGPEHREGAVFLVIAGLVRLHCLPENGDQLILERLPAGQVFGLPFLAPAVTPALFCDRWMIAGRNLTCVARFPVDGLKRLMHEVPALADRIEQVWAEQTEREQAQRRALMTQTLKERLWSLLNEIARSEPDGSVPESQEELAQSLGCCRPRVNAALRELMAQGYISYQGSGPITVEVLARRQLSLR